VPNPWYRYLHTAWPRQRRGRCNDVADATASPRRHDGVVLLVMVLMVTYCCSVPRSHLLHYILTWLVLLCYYRYDLIYVLRLMPTASFVATAVIRNVCAMIFISAAVSFFTTAVIRCCGRCRRYGRDCPFDCRRHGAHCGHATRRNTMKTKSTSSVVVLT
jgi:hypothetical protein